MKSAIITIGDTKTFYQVFTGDGEHHSFWSSESKAKRACDLLKNESSDACYTPIPIDPALSLGPLVFINLTTGERTVYFVPKKTALISDDSPASAWGFNFTLGDINLFAKIKFINNSWQMRSINFGSVAWNECLIGAKAETVEEAMDLAMAKREEAMNLFVDMPHRSCSECGSTEVKEWDSPRTFGSIGNWFCSSLCYNSHREDNIPF
jgi:hypothetical protein